MSTKPAYKMLRIDLTNEKVSVEELNERMVRKFLGGAGLSAKILWDETEADTDPLSEENVLIFSVGPLTAPAVPHSSRYVVAALSPLTGIYGEGHAGGTWGAALSRAGYMAIVVKGKARRPVYIWVKDGEVKIVDAHHVWGMDTYDLDAVLKKETDQKASVAAIGPAGEKLVRIATIMSDGPSAKCVGRCGLGAVMGSKNLKAIVVAGTGKHEFYNPEKLKESVSKHFPMVRPVPPGEADIRLERARHWCDERGGIKNFQLGEFKGFGEKIFKYFSRPDAKPEFCPHCRTGCAMSRLVNGKRLAHAEQQIPMGANCLVDNMDALEEAFEMCNRYGVDTISAGDIIAFAMECYEKGLITRDQTEGIELTWGNHEAMLQILQKIVNAEGLGKLLGSGTRRAAAQIGGTAEEYAMHVKGLEIALHDPRRSNSYALQHATANRGGDHMDGFIGLYAQYLEQWNPGFGRSGYGFDFLDDKAREAARNPFAVEGVGKLVAWAQDLTCVQDSLTICMYNGYPIGWIRAPSNRLLVFSRHNGQSG